MGKKNKDLSQFPPPTLVEGPIDCVLVGANVMCFSADGAYTLHVKYRLVGALMGEYDVEGVRGGRGRTALPAPHSHPPHIPNRLAPLAPPAGPVPVSTRPAHVRGGAPRPLQGLDPHSVRPAAPRRARAAPLHFSGRVRGLSASICWVLWLLTLSILLFYSLYRVRAAGPSVVPHPSHPSVRCNTVRGVCVRCEGQHV